MAVPPADDVILRLTATEAVARALRGEHALERRNSGLSVWEAPAIHSLRRWCRDQWLQTWPSGQLLHPVQETALWQQAIADDDASRDLIAANALARQAQAASQLVVRHGIDLAGSPRYTDEQQAFARWHRRVLAELQARDWIREVDLPARTADLVRAGRIAAPRQVRFCAHYRPLAAAERGLLDALKDAGAEVVIDAAAEPRAVFDARVYEDDEQQWQALAAQLRELLLPFADRDDTLPRILLTCPDVAMRRDHIEAVLRPVLAPWLALPGEGTRPVPWRFADGRGLDRVPLIAVALSICGLTLHDNGMDELSRVLLAGALWQPDARAATAAADYALRREGGSRFSLAAVAGHLTEPVRSLFSKLLVVVRKAPSRALPSTWAAHYGERLNALGWPGARSLSSADFQARERWLEALMALSAMDEQIGAIPQSRALFWLREIVSNRAFEPRSDTEQPIQILSLNQAAGLPADRLFVLDATDDHLPRAVQRQPFIAIETLRATAVPAVTPELALEDSRRLAAQLQGTAATIHLSYARSDARGAEKTATTVFGSREWRAARCDTPLTAAARTAANGPLTVLPAADPVPPVQDPVTEGIGGGTKIFKNYVDAPFFAFCIHRLGIEPLPEPGPGLTALAQGVVMHDVLEDLWRELKTQRALKALDDNALAARLDAPLDAAMAEHMPADRYGRRLREIERARLHDVLMQWLRHERRRADDFEAIAFELEVPMTIEGLALQLRIDRVDCVQGEMGERLLVIDYKTGRSVDIGGWDVDELKEPQLPLYATSPVLGAAGIPRVDGIAFAHVRDGRPALAPLTNWRLRLLEGEKLKLIDNWDAHLVAWRERLFEIARGFLAGDAGIDLSRSRDQEFNAELLDLVREDA